MAFGDASVLPNMGDEQAIPNCYAEAAWLMLLIRERCSRHRMAGRFEPVHILPSIAISIYESSLIYS